MADYQKLKIQETLQISLQCASRQLQPAQFAQMSQQVSSAGRIACDQTRLALYPQEMRSYVQRSAYNIALPENVGRFLEEGFKGNIETTPSSAEVNHRIEAVRTTASDLQNLVFALKKMETEPIKVPDGCISVDFMLPREAFANDAQKFLELNKDFTELLSYLAEYYGQVGRPDLVYASTSDPVLGFAAFVSSAYGVVKLFNQMLVAARNAVELYRAIKLLRDQNIMSEALHTMVKNTEAAIKSSVEKLVAEQIQAVRSDVEESRRNGLRHAITNKCMILVPLISEGASIGISIESLGAITTVKVEGLAEGEPSFVELVVEARKTEIQTRTAIAIAGGSANLRLTHEADKPPSD